MGVLLRTDLTGHGHPIHFGSFWWDGRAVLHPLPKIISSDSTSITKKSKYSLEKLPGNYEKKIF